MGLILGGVSANDLILDGSSVSLYVGGNPPTKVWPTRETVQVTLGSGYEARNQFRAALVDRGLDYRTVTEIPFDIELVGSGSARDMFNGCAALTHVRAMDTSQVTNMTGMFAFCTALTSVPAMDTSQVTTMTYMFNRCSSLTTVPAMDTSRVTDMRYRFLTCTSLTHAPAMDTSSVTTMNSIFSNCAALTYVPDMVTGQATDLGFMFYNCSALTDGNVRLIGKHPSVNTINIIANSGLTRQPFYDTNGNPI